MLKMCWDASVFQLTKITRLITHLVTSRGPMSDLEKAKANLYHEQRKLAEYAQRAAELGYEGFKLDGCLAA
jgi:hypothetical protein